MAALRVSHALSAAADFGLDFACAYACYLGVVCACCAEQPVRSDFARLRTTLFHPPDPTRIVSTERENDWFSRRPTGAVLWLWSTCGDVVCAVDDVVGCALLCSTSYYRSSDAILLIFDVSEKQTFKNCEVWLEDVRLYAKEKVDIMLVGNKADLVSKRQIDYKTAKEFADRNGMSYMETSAKQNVNVDKAFVRTTPRASGLSPRSRSQLSLWASAALLCCTRRHPTDRPLCC
jgi:hypothetical protein